MTLAVALAVIGSSKSSHAAPDAVGAVQQAAAVSSGRVTFAGLPVPGATITAVRGEATRVTTSNTEGRYALADLSAGEWTIRVEMVGFAPLSGVIAVPAEGPSPTWELALRSFDEIARELPAGPVVSRGSVEATTRAAANAADATVSTPGGFQRAAVNASIAPSPAVLTSPPEADAAGSDRSDSGTALGGVFGAAEGFLINGSVNNGAATPFAQARAFGNNRPGQRSLWNGGVALLGNTSAWDARPYSFARGEALRPNYADVQFNGTFGGPIKIPGVRNRPNVFVGVQRARDRSANTYSALVPSLLEREGDFSQSRDAVGRVRQIVDPRTGLPFPGNRIPADRISPQAATLLGYYPRPDMLPGAQSSAGVGTQSSAGAGGQSSAEYHTVLVADTRQDSLQARATQVLTNRNQLTGTLAYGRGATDAPSLFDFSDATRGASLDTTINVSHRLTPFTFLRARYQFARTSTNVTPAFARRFNISGLAGIAGNNQDPENWGPPGLAFASGIAGLSSAQYAENTTITHGPGGELFWTQGRHGWTFGGAVRDQRFDVFSQQNARGTFGFTGAASGSDVADFLLGLPTTSAIAFGNADKYLRSRNAEAYANDDWRVSASLTLNLGLRWEYESPITEARQRLVNLDITPGFASAAPVVASRPVGPLTGRAFDASLVRPDRGGVQPRIGVAWRPVPGSSLVIRGGYGLYRNTSTYQSIALLLAQQPPLSTTSSVATSTTRPLTLADGFVTPASASPASVLNAASVPNTFAVDPDLRVSIAENWQASAQRDLPASLTIVGTYLGTRGHRLLQEVLPNTYPAGAVNPCPTCPSGFIYLTSGGTSIRHAGQVLARRRLRNGLTASVQYTLAKASDDAAAFSGTALGGTASGNTAPGNSATGSTAPGGTALANTALGSAAPGSAALGNAALGNAALGNAAVAQNWLDLDAEYGRSSFDQRHAVVAQAQYTTGAGITGGTLVDGLRGRLFKDWTVVAQLTAGSGLPLTPVYLTPVIGTGVTGTVRASLTGASVDAVPAGAYLNPAAYAPPAPGAWGTARRNSVSGPSQFGVNAAVGRTFRWGNRLNLDWRFDATNVLNQVTFASVNTIVGSPQFGLPTRANQMRKLQSSLRVRF